MKLFVWIRRCRGTVWCIRRIYDDAAGGNHLDTERAVDIGLGAFAIRVGVLTIFNENDGR